MCFRPRRTNFRLFGAPTVFDKARPKNFSVGWLSGLAAIRRPRTRPAYSGFPVSTTRSTKQNFLVELAAGTLPEPVYQRSDFRIETISQEPGTALRKAISVQFAGSESANTQSERDWTYAIRHLRHGDDPELIICEIAAYRATDRNDSRDTGKPISVRKPNPRYYAEHTVSRAMTHLGMTRTLGGNEIGSPENEPER